jgi:hypothetical protein
MFLALKSILLRCGELILLRNQLKLLVAVRRKQGNSKLSASGNTDERILAEL